MGLVIRQSMKGSVVSYAGAVIGSLSTIFIYPFFLSPELIGLNRILTDSAFLFAFIAQVGIPNAIIRFSPMLRQKGMIREAYRYALLLPLISFVFFGSILLLGKESIQGIFSDNSPLFSRYFVLVIPFGLVCIYMNIIETFSTAYLRITIPRLIREVILRILLITGVLIYFYLEFSIDVYVLMVIASYALAAAILASYFKRLQNLKTPREGGERIPAEIARKVFPYMGFMLLAGIGSNIVTKVDAFMISSMLGLGSTGIYTISFFMASVIEIPSRATIQISAPFVSESLEANNIGRLKDLYVRYTANQGIIGGLLFILLWANLPSIFELMPNGDLYTPGRHVVLFIGLGKLIDVTTGINNLILVYSKYHRFQILFVVILGAITVAGNYLLIPVLGITGAAIASLSAYFIINTIVIWFLHHKIGIQPFTRKTLWIVLLVMLVFAINFLLPSLDSWFWDSAYRSAIILGVYSGITYFCRLSEDINAVALKVLEMAGLKRKKG
jgi:O-antigen/teichoic acid export membrane protein